MGSIGQTTKDLFYLLLQGKYLRKRMNNKGESVFVMYEGNQSPLCFFPAHAADEIKHLIKKDKKGKITLNLNLVKQLDGRSSLKKIYKKHIHNTARGNPLSSVNNGNPSIAV